MATDLTPAPATDNGLGEINKYDFVTPTTPVFKAEKGINREIVAQISEMKNEPGWMRDFRLEAFKIFESKPMPTWGGDIALDFQDIYYYLKPTSEQGKTWDDVPQEIKDTFDKLGIPEAEKKYLAGVKAQFESEVVYGSLQEDLGNKGVIFTDTDTAVREHPKLLREYFGKIIPSTDNKFAALNSAVWSGGSFIYVPPGVKIEFPAGVLPHQRRADGPVRADTHYRRRRCRSALCRRLHRPDVHDREPALGGGRGDGQEKRSLPLHDNPELGQQHLQPRHQTSDGLRKRSDGMGRRQPGQPSHDEIPGRLHDGARCPR